MNRKTPTTTIGLLLLIALVIGACQQATGQATLTIEELQQQAEAGDAEAQYLLGLAYEDEEGVEQDFTQASHWWKKAAEQGHALAQTRLGLAYGLGEGVLKDFNRAAHWWKKAAEQGHPEAQYLLGAAYWGGEGVNQDSTEAYAWIIIAQATGGETEEETERMRDLTNLIENELLIPAQLEEAQQRASELHEQIQANIAKRDQAN